MRGALLLAGIFCALVVHTPPTTKFGSRFAFVCDVSGSMSGPKLDAAIEGYAEIAEQSTDSMMMSVRAFDNHCASWPSADGTGWAPLPDADAIKRATAWLYARAQYGATRPGPALVAALSEPHKGLAVILISDGDFYQASTASLLAKVEAAQKARATKYGRAAIACVYVGSKKHPPKVLQRLATAGRGGLFVVK